MDGLEVCMCENKEIVGMTGVLAVDEERILPINGPHYKSLTQSFGDEFEIIDAGRAMTCLIVDELQPDGSVKHGYGTAFFVADNILLTAGHNLVSRRGYNIIGIRVTIPGTKVVQLGLDGTLTLRCKIISNSFKEFNGCGREDIAILKCSGLATPARYLPLATDQGDLSPRAMVDVIGYPGFIETAWMERQHKGKLKDFEESAKVARKMLPERTLTVSRGSVEETKDGLCSYYVSTCPGMSGGALISKGNVYGVHLGQLSASSHRNSAVLFNEPKVSELLRVHLLSQRESSEDNDVVIITAHWNSSSNQRI